ncbi:MAG: L,D-transpeptidase family protein, partial [Thermomicrobiales bacterium]|nr:L,D-transpeptidase family protein [Thermomicrobiales bacterium]
MLAFGVIRTARRPFSGLGLPLLALLALLVPILTIGVSPGATAAQSDWSPPRTVFIPETGQTIDGVFLDQWRAGGGVNAYGYPITAELTENDRIVQYYEYARFEYVPDDPEGIVVHLGKIGEELKPVTVFRSVPNISGSGGSGGSLSYLANETRAWIPLADDAVAQPNTDTLTYVPETRHTVQHGFKDFWEATGGAAYLGNPISEEFQGARGIRYQVFERGKLAWSEADGVHMLPVGSILARQYNLETTGTPTSDYPTYSEDLFIEPEPEAPVIDGSGELWIEVNLSSQYMVVWEGSEAVAETYVSTGRDGFDTPPGTFYINSKLEFQTMEGVLGGEYYNVPDVPWVMYFTDVGHAIHGAYWHNNFGSVMSHGCVNLPLDIAEFVYTNSPIGT